MVLNLSGLEWNSDVVSPADSLPTWEFTVERSCYIISTLVTTQLLQKNTHTHTENRHSCLVNLIQKYVHKCAFFCLVILWEYCLHLLDFYYIVWHLSSCKTDWFFFASASSKRLPTCWKWSWYVKRFLMFKVLCMKNEKIENCYDEWLQWYSQPTRTHAFVIWLLIHFADRLTNRYKHWQKDEWKIFENNKYRKTNKILMLQWSDFHAFPACDIMWI